MLQTWHLSTEIQLLLSLITEINLINLIPAFLEQEEEKGLHTTQHYRTQTIIQKGYYLT